MTYLLTKSISPLFDSRLGTWSEHMSRDNKRGEIQNVLNLKLLRCCCCCSWLACIIVLRPQPLTPRGSHCYTCIAKSDNATTQCYLAIFPRAIKPFIINKPGSTWASPDITTACSVARSAFASLPTNLRLKKQKKNSN